MSAAPQCKRKMRPLFRGRFLKRAWPERYVLVLLHAIHGLSSARLGNRRRLRALWIGARKAVAGDPKHAIPLFAKDKQLLIRLGTGLPGGVI